MPARRIWSDQAADLSIFFAENIDLVPSLRFRCGVPLATGERIYMVGFPGGDDIAATVAWGNVGIAIPDSEGHVSADLAAPAGTSGAPVIDSRGLVVGVGQGTLARRYRTMGGTLTVPLGVAYLAPPETLCTTLAPHLPPETFHYTQ